jgi:Zn-dependent protease with chaperone function
VGSATLLELADVSIRALCLAAAALAGVRLGRARSAQVRHAVWAAVLLGMLALPVLTFSVPPVRFEVLRAQPQGMVLPPGANTPVALAGSSRAAGPTRAGGAARPRDWGTLALACYLAVALAFLGRLMFGYALAWRLAGASRPIRDERAADLLARFVPAFPPPELLESEAVAAPVTVGWLSPVVVLPSGWREWTQGKLEAVLAHELAHVRRRDWLIAVLAGLNKCIFWFHPLAWWLERKLAALAERACDEASLLVVRDRREYARALLEIAAAVRSAGGRLAWHSLAMAGSSRMRERIEAVLDERRAAHPLTMRARAAVALCAAPLLYGAAAVQFQAPQPKPDVFQTGSPYLRSLVDGNRLAPAEVEMLEGYLRANPEELIVRGRLIAYYFLNAVREPRLKHIFWLIEHHPESEIAGFNSAGISPRSTVLNDPGDYDRAKALWLEQAYRRGSDVRVLSNAAVFFWHFEPEIASDLLDRARRVARGGPPGRPYGRGEDLMLLERHALLYAGVIAGAMVEAPDWSPWAQPALAERWKAELESSSDALLVVLTANKLRSNARALKTMPRPQETWIRQSAGLEESADRLLQRAKELELGRSDR